MHRFLLFALVATFVATGALAQEEASPQPAEESASVEAGDDAEAEPVAPPEEESAEAEADEAEPTAPSGPLVGRMPALRGYTGLFHINTADTTETLTLTLGLFGQWFKASNVVREGDENTRFLGRLTLSVAAHPNVEVFASLMASGNVNNFAEPQLIQSLGDFMLGAKGFGFIDEAFSAGGSATIFFLNGANDVGVDFSATSLDLRGLLSYNFAASHGIPLAMHFNAAFLLDNSAHLFDVELQRVERFAQRVSDFSFFEFGLGFEFPVPYVTPVLEWNLGIPVGNGDEDECATNPIPCPHDAGFGSFPNTLTLGLRGTPVQNLALMLGVDIGLTTKEATGLPAVAPYDILFGISYNLDPRPRVDPEPAVPPTGWILGEVVADETAEPIGGATVSYPGTDLTAQLTDPTTGRFRSYELPVDSEVSIEVSHPMYETRSFARLITEGQDGIRIRMQPSVTMLRGEVTSAIGTPVAATVYIDGTESMELELDPTAAEFEVELEEGEYVITVVADDHVSQRERLALGPGVTEWRAALSSLPAGQVAVLDHNRIRIMGGRVSFVDLDGDELDPEGEAVLSQVVDLLRENADLNVRVVGHGDDSATVELTEQQADIAIQYLVNAGIDASRLSGEGAGGTQPLVPNISPRNRQRNWRVEFLFVD